MNPPAPGFFITGTDTGVGKSRVSAALLLALRALGLKAVGMKPVASGCIPDKGLLRSEDALLLQKHASCQAPYAYVNPYAFAPAISPHLAAQNARQRVDFHHIRACFDELLKLSECVVVEGAGGWETPLTDEQNVSDLARFLGLPVILVVGLRLGCLNHAILSYHAIQRSGLRCAGWVANSLEENMPYAAENVSTLKQRLASPCLAVLPYNPSLSEGLAEAAPLIAQGLAFLWD